MLQNAYGFTGMYLKCWYDFQLDIRNAQVSFYVCTRSILRSGSAVHTQSKYLYIFVTNEPFSEYNKISSKLGGVGLLIMFAYSVFVFVVLRRSGFAVLFICILYIRVRVLSAKTEVHYATAYNL